MDSKKHSTFTDLSRYRPVPWEQIPDLGLYMDQIITFITRVYEPLYGETTKSYLSAPMINNYVKNKLIPRPSGKKYGRMQIALLIMLVSLKRVCTMEEIRQMFAYENEEDVRTLYGQFCRRQEISIRQMLATERDIDPAIDCAIFASSYRAGCEALLQEPVSKKGEE